MNDDIAVEVRNLSKEYRMGQLQAGYSTLKDALSRPFQRSSQESAQDGQLFWALRDVSFEVRRGEGFGVIGRNGAGKTTLLKILARTINPTEGYAELRGRTAPLLAVGTGFDPNLTGRENIFLNGAILGMKRSEIRARFDEIVEFAEIGRFLDTPVKRYSSGMYVRLAFSVAAHLEPDILIADEVLAVGDMAFQQKCLARMGAAANQGRTVLFVSHSTASVQNFCERTLYLEHGRIKMVGPTKDVIAAYTADMGMTPPVDVQAKEPPAGPNGRVNRDAPGELALPARADPRAQSRSNQP